MPMSIYDEIGGASAVRAAVERLYAKVLADDRLVGYFNLDRIGELMDHQRAFITTALGGPMSYRGRSMREAHEALHILPDHFDAVVEHLVAALVELGVPPMTIDQIGTRLLPLKPEIALGSQPAEQQA